MDQALNNHAAAREWYAKAQSERQSRDAGLPSQLVSVRGHVQVSNPGRSLGSLPIELQLFIAEMLDYDTLKRLR